MIPELPILIVEDDGLIAMHLAELLEHAGYLVMPPERSGERALERLQRPPLPGLILMDVGLDGKLDGIETARRIRSRYDIPVIFLTAYSDEGRVAEAATVSPYGFLAKPCMEHQLLDAVRKVLG